MLCKAMLLDSSCKFHCSNILKNYKNALTSHLSQMVIWPFKVLPKSSFWIFLKKSGKLRLWMIVLLHRDVKLADFSYWNYDISQYNATMLKARLKKLWWTKRKKFFDYSSWGGYKKCLTAFLNTTYLLFCTGSLM